tara:strand:- start:1838 stop:2170 length:333 start_codon:yes stop_codon:yes gene_type:complete
MGMKCPTELSAPIEKYTTIHLDYNQKFNSKISYPPILISKDLSTIQTHVGFLTTTLNKTEKFTQGQESELSLMEYNNNYYYLDTEVSMKGLENYYSPKFIQEEWVALLES